MCWTIFLLILVVTLTLAQNNTGPFWRNDSANIALTASWNDYLDATPFSWDITSSSISDSPPVTLEWSIGKDLPQGQKDGVGCLIDGHFVIAGGLWTDLSVKGGNPKTKITDGLAMHFDFVNKTWQSLPKPPYVQSRGTGCCTTNALYLVSGRPPSGEGSTVLSVARLTRKNANATESSSSWTWESLPPLPSGTGRWLGAAGVAGEWLILATGTNTSKFQRDHELRSHIKLTNRSTSLVPPSDLPHLMPSFRLNLRAFDASPETVSWEPIAKFPGGGLDAPNTAVVGGKLYIFGGWRGSIAGIEAWSNIYNLHLSVPITVGTNGGRLLRASWKYDPDTGAWSQLPDAPQHIEQGGTIVLRDRWVLHMGSTHGKNSFRVGLDADAHGWVPDAQLGKVGIATYYADEVLAFDTKTLQYSRVGKLPYGLITSHWSTNGTHLIGVGGEPRHGWNNNAENVMQIAKIKWNE